MSSPISEVKPTDQQRPAQAPVDDPVSKITAFAAEFEVNMVGLGRDDVQEAYGPILGMPTTFFIKRDGSVCKTHTGLATKDDIEQDIKELL